MIAFQNPGIDVSILVFCFLTIIKIFLIFFSNSPFYFKSVSTFQIIISNFKIYNKNNLSLMGFQYLTHTNWLRILLNFVKAMEYIFIEKKKKKNEMLKCRVGARLGTTKERKNIVKEDGLCSSKPMTHVPVLSTCYRLHCRIQNQNSSQPMHLGIKIKASYKGRVLLALISTAVEQQHRE